MRITNKTTFGEVLMYMSVFRLTDEQVIPLYEAARGRAVPDDMKFDYNKLIFGKLALIQKFETSGQFFIEAPPLVLLREQLKYEPLFVYKLRATRWTRKLLKRSAPDVFAFVLHMKDELERIARLFESIQHVPTREEERAGVNEIRGSMHSIADWYAQRMGITDVSSVYLIPWLIIFQAMKIDKQNNDIKRRLYEQANKAK